MSAVPHAWVEEQSIAVARGAATSHQRPISTLQIGLGSVTGNAGGAERIFTELAAHLPASGVSFCGAVPESSQHPCAAARFGFAPAGASTKARVIGARRAVGDALRQQKFDLIASHFALYSFPALGKTRGYPHVAHFHGPWAAESILEGSGRAAALAKLQIERTVYSRAQRVITLSHAFADLLQQTYKVPEEKIRIVPGSVDIEKFTVSMERAEARAILGWPSDRFILLSLRRLSHRMGLDLLIDAMRAVVARFPEALLYLGGKGHMRAQLEQQVESAWLADHIKFLGYIPEEHLPLVYRAADLNVVPTRAWEGFGLVAAEALAAGTPSMVTPVGGLPEVVSPLSPDLIFRSASSADIAEGILAVLSGDTRLPDAQACASYAARNFSSPLMASRTAAVYREVLNG